MERRQFPRECMTWKWNTYWRVVGPPSTHFCRISCTLLGTRGWEFTFIVPERPMQIQATEVVLFLCSHFWLLSFANLTCFSNVISSFSLSCFARHTLCLLSPDFNFPLHLKFLPFSFLGLHLFSFFFWVKYEDDGCSSLAIENLRFGEKNEGFPWDTGHWSWFGSKDITVRFCCWINCFHGYHSQFL